MTNLPEKTIDFLIHEMDNSSTTSATISLANALLKNGTNARLVVLGEDAPPPLPLHEKLTVKFLNINKGKGRIGKILYMTRAYFLFSTYLAKNQTRHLFVWGTDLIILAEIIRITLILPYKLVGVNDVNIFSRMVGKNKLQIKILNFFYKEIFKSPDCLITHTQEISGKLQEGYLIPADKINSIYPPVREVFFEQGAQKKSSGKLLFVGKFNEQKNPIAALEILQNLEDKSTTLEFVGDDNMEAQLKNKASELGLDSRVIFSGWQKDIIPFLDKADLLICTSKYEDFGIALAESVARGLPVVAYDCKTGPSEIILDGENGYLITPGRADIFAHKINQALKNKWEYKRVAQTVQKFHPNVLLKEYIEVIRKKLT